MATGKEESKAIQASAEAAKSLADLAREFGAYWGRFLSGPLRQLSGIAEDWLGVLRMERAVKLKGRVEKCMAELGVSAPDNPLPPGILLPLVGHATLEDDDTLQDMWARLIANGSVHASGVTLRPTYVDIMRGLTPLDAQVLKAIYAVQFDDSQPRAVVTENLPESASQENRIEKSHRDLKSPPENVIDSLSTLAGLNCISFPTTWDGGQFYSLIYQTVTGRNFVSACTARKRQKP